MLSSNGVKDVLRRVCGIVRASEIMNDTGVVRFDGGASLDDMSIDSDGYTALLPKQFIVRISAVGTPDSFRFSSDGGSTWSVEAAITGSSQPLAFGINVTFGATTGHDLGNSWTFVTSPPYGNERLRDFIVTVDDVEVLNDMLSSVYSAGKAQTITTAKYKSEAKSIIAALSKALPDDNLDTYLTAQSLLANSEVVLYSLASVSAVNVIPPVTVLGEFVFSGANAGTFTQGAAINTQKFNGGLIELYALTDITDTGTDGVVSITGTDFSDTAVSETVAVAYGGNVSQYTAIDLSSAYPQRFKSVSDISVTGGAAGQRFQIRTKEDWAPIL